MTLPKINPSGNFNYPFLQTSAALNENPDLSNLICQLDKAREYVMDSAAVKPAGENKIQKTEKPKLPLTAEAVGSVKFAFPSIISPDGRYFLYRDPEDKYKIKIFDTLTKKDIGKKTLQNIQNIQNHRCEQKEKKGKKPDGKEYAIMDFSSDGKSLIIYSKEEKFVRRNGEKGEIKTEITETKLYSIDINTGEKKLLVNLREKSNFNLKYIRRQNAVYLEEIMPEESVQNMIGRYPQTTRLWRVSKISLDKEKDKTAMVIYEGNRNDSDCSDFKYSPDGNYMAFDKNPTHGRTSGEIYLYDIKNKKEYRVTQNGRYENIIGWSPDSKYIIFTQTTRDNNGNSQYGLWLFDTDKKIQKPLAEKEDLFVDNKDVFISKNNYLYFSAPKGFYTNLYRIDLGKINTGDNVLPAPELILSSQDGFVSGWRLSDDGNKIYYNTDNDSAPSVLTCLDTASGQKEIIKNPNKDFFKKYEIPKSEIKRFAYKAEDGKFVEIEYKITYPAGYDKSNAQKYSLAVLIHGGPNERHDAGFNIFEQPNLFATQGYITIIPNIRGSKGYGQAFLESLWSDKPDNNVSSKGREDILAAIDHLVDTSSGKIDTAKIGLYGFSYGGSLTEYIAAMPSKYKFKCAVSGAGLSLYSSQRTTLKNLWPQIDNIYLPENADSIYRASALAALAESRKKDPAFRTPPILLVHGDKDDNVEFKNSELFYNELMRQGMDARFAVYKGAKHSGPQGSYGSRSNQDYIIQWFNHFCQPEKEVYDSKTYGIYSHDGKKRLNDINAFPTGGVGPIKSSKAGRKFAVIRFTADAEGILTLDASAKTITMEDADGKGGTHALKLIDKGAGWETATDKNPRIYSTAPKRIELVFEVPENKKEFLLKISSFPPIKITLEN